jgi:hypothetical protein
MGILQPGNAPAATLRSRSGSGPRQTPGAYAPAAQVRPGDLLPLPTRGGGGRFGPASFALCPRGKGGRWRCELGAAPVAGSAEGGGEGTYSLRSCKWTAAFTRAPSPRVQLHLSPQASPQLHLSPQASPRLRLSPPGFASVPQASQSPRLRLSPPGFASVPQRQLPAVRAAGRSSAGTRRAQRHSLRPVPRVALNPHLALALALPLQAES